MAPLLELDGVSMAFGGLDVISDLDLEVAEGEIVSVIGPNGAGKTTLFNLVTGVYRPTNGDIRLGGRSLVGLDPHKITQLGVARTFQTLRLFLNMSVKENVMAAAYGHTKAGVFRAMLRTPGMRREERQIAALAEEKLGFFGQRLMGYRWNQPAYSLSYANRRRLEIARAMATNARVLLLDEPAAGMNPAETQEITGLIGELRAQHVVEGISDRVVALDHGVKIAEGSFESVATDPRVVEAYLGTGEVARK
jgi:branched-chain amino acid transport system ATP-binding protein